MSLPDPKIVQANVAVLKKLNDQELIMITLAEIVQALAMSNNPGIPPGKAIALAYECSERARCKW